MPVRTAVIGYVCIALAAVVLVLSDALQTADHAILDTQFKALRTGWARPGRRDGVIGGIDEESVQRFPEPLSLWHAHFGKFLRATAAGGAAAVGLDVVLPGRS